LFFGKVKQVAGKLPAVKPKKAIRALERGGFVVHHVTGSHYIMKKGKQRVTVRYHNKDLSPRLLATIIAQSGLTVDEFLALL
jgi:predicted RNA binding protein YcfA (HicA-like mRNA interferase family)